MNQPPKLVDIQPLPKAAAKPRKRGRPRTKPVKEKMNQSDARRKNLEKARAVRKARKLVKQADENKDQVAVKKRELDKLLTKTQKKALLRDKPAGQQERAGDLFKARDGSDVNLAERYDNPHEEEGGLKRDNVKYGVDPRYSATEGEIKFAGAEAFDNLNRKYDSLLSRFEQFCESSKTGTCVESDIGDRPVVSQQQEKSIDEHDVIQRKFPPNYHQTTPQQHGRGFVLERQQSKIDYSAYSLARKGGGKFLW